MPQSPDSYVLEASRTGTLHVLFILLKSYTVLEYLVLVFGFVWFLELRKQTRENAVICPRSCHPCVQSQAGLGPPLSYCVHSPHRGGSKHPDRLVPGRLCSLHIPP